MTTRRDVLKGIAAGGAVATVPVAAGALTGGTGGDAEQGWLLAPLRSGYRLGLGWHLGDLGVIEEGAIVISLVHDDRRVARVHLCLLGDDGARGVAQSHLFDFVLMDGRAGDAATDEGLGRVVLGLAAVVRENEIDARGDLRPLAQLMAHDERVLAFGPEHLLRARGGIV